MKTKPQFPDEAYVKSCRIAGMCPNCGQLGFGCTCPKPTPMTTDHTETPETSVKHCRTEYLRWWLNPDRKPPEPPNGWDVAEKMEQELTQARAALATAMEERDEARKRISEYATELSSVRKAKDQANELYEIATREKVQSIVDPVVMAALRARNDALTKALEDAEELFHTASERVEAKREYDADPQVTCRRCGIADQDLAIAVEKYGKARRALGKEGL